MTRKIFTTLLCFSTFLLTSLSATTLTVNVNTDSAPTTGGVGAGTTGDLRYILNYINLHPDTYSVVFDLSAGNETITLAGLLPILNLNTANQVTIDGSNTLGSSVEVSLNGANTQRGFIAQQGTIQIQNMNIENTVITGGAGGSGGLTGGSGAGGLGAGGGLFINEAQVTVSNLTFSNNSATGGSGGASAAANIIGGGGGGMGGAGGSSGGVTGASPGGGGGGGIGGAGGNGGENIYGGGGGIGPGGNGGSTGVGSSGGGFGAGSGGSGQSGGNAGGADAGGGGGSSSLTGAGGGGGGAGGQNGTASAGGNGAFGGGGGASAGTGGFGGGGGGSSSVAGGQGGFGGGGGGSASGNGGTGGFGGGGGGTTSGIAGSGGVGGGSGTTGANTNGGGGAGLGGAIFVNSSTSYGQGGGKLIVTGPLTTSSNSVTAGAAGGAGATAGAAAATDIFATSGQPLTFTPPVSNTVTINGSIGDDSANTLPGGTYTAGAGSGVNVVMNGAGTLQLLGTNTYAGGTNLSAGTLQINSDASLGEAGSTLDVTGAATLQTAGAFTSSHPIDLNANALTFDTDGNNITWGAQISGSGGSLNKISSGILTLTQSNTYTNGTTITTGTLALSGGGALASTGAVIVDSGAIFDISAASGNETIGDYSGAGNTNLGANTLTFGTANTTSYTGVISGAGGGLTKQGSGTMTLTGINTYTGTTSVTAGELVVSQSTTGTFSGPYAISSGAHLDFEQAATTTETYSGGISGSGNLTFNQNGGTGTVALTGPMTFTGAATVFAGTLQGSPASLPPSITDAASAIVDFEQTSGTGTYTGSIAGGGSVVVNSVGGNMGTVVLSGTNSYSGGTTVVAGTLEGTTSSLQGAITADSGTKVDFEQTSGTGTYSGIITGGGIVAINSVGGNTGTVVFTGANNYSGGTDVFSGILQGTTTSLQGNIAVTSPGAVDFEQSSGTGTYAGVISGTGAVDINSQTGNTGTVSFTGMNTYSGGTTVGHGTFLGTTTSLQGNIAIGSGATVDFEQNSGSGTYSSILSGNGGVLINSSPSNTGTVVFTGANTYHGGTTIDNGTLRGTATSLQGNIVVSTGAFVDFEQTSGTGTYSGSIAGGGELIVNAVGGNIGTLVLSGTNSYSGGTMVDAGTLQGSTTSLQGAITVATGASLDFEQSSGTGTYSGIISGAGIVDINSVSGDTGTVVFTGANNYSGGTNIFNGTLQGTTTSLQGNIAVTTPGTVDFEQTSGTGTYSSVISGTGAVAVNSIAGNIGTVTFTGANTYSGGTSVGYGTLEGTAVSLQGNILANGGAVVDFEQTSGTGTYAGILSGAGSVAINSTPGNTGTVVFIGANTYNGGTSIDSGTLRGTTTSLQGNILVNSGAFADFEQTSSTGTYSGNISGAGGVVINSLFSDVGTVVFTGTNTYNGGTSVEHGIFRGSTSSLQGNMAVSSGATVDFEQASGSGTYSGAISGAGKVLINSVGGDTGTVIFSGPNTYSGGTTVDAGTLQGTGTSLQGAITANSGTIVDLEQSSGTGTFSGAITGAGRVVINSVGGDTGTVVFTGANAYTGGTTVIAGTLQGTSNTLTGNILVDNGATVDVEQASGSGTYSGIISGNGVVTINEAGGTGTVIFSGANTYAGGTLIDNGTLQGTVTSLQGNMQIAGGADLSFEQSSGTGTFAGRVTGAGSLTVNSIFGNNGTLVLTGSNSYSGGTFVDNGTLQGGTNSLQGNMTVASTGTVAFEQTSGTGTYAGVISGAGDVVVNSVGGNTGTIVFSGANTYSGGTTVDAGTLQGTTSSLQGNITAVSGATVDFEQNSGSGTYSGIISGAGSVLINSNAINDGTVIFSSANTYSGGTTVNSGVLQLAPANLPGNVTVNPAGQVDFEQASGSGLYSGIISGNGGVSINQAGSTGTVILSGANTYTHGTVIYNGTLQGTATSLQGNMLVDSGAALDFEQTSSTGTYSGVISGAGGVVINSIFGNNGTVVFTGTNAYNGGTTIDNGTLRGTTRSLQGNMLVGSGATLDFEQGTGSGTYSGNISGAGSVAINSVAGDIGTVIFSGTNTYTGGTSVEGGILLGTLTSLQGNFSTSSGAIVDFEQTAGTGTYTGVISGAGGVAINSLTGDTGTVVFSSLQTYMGNTIVDKGELQVTPLTLQGNIVVNNTGTIDFEQSSGTGTYSGNISGAGALLVNSVAGDTGTVVLTGTNTYTGGTTVDAGILQGTSSGLQGAITVNSSALVDFEQTSGTGTYSGNLSGSGGVVINSISGNTGTVVLSGNNSYTGGTTVDAGTLEGTTTSLQGNILANSGGTVDFENSLSGTYSGVISGGGDVTINAAGALGTVIFTGANTYMGGTTVEHGRLQGTVNSLQGNIAVDTGASLDFEQASGSGTYTGVISGLGGVVVNSVAGDTGTVIFTGSNTYSGGTTVDNGTLQGTITSIQGTVTVNTGALVDLEQASGTGTFSGNISGLGGLSINSVSGDTGTIVLNGTNSYSGGTAVHAGTLQGTTASVQGNIAVNTAAIVDFEQASGSGTYSGNISGGGSVAINSQAGDVGRVIFSGSNSYTGGTSLFNGSLQGTASSLQGNIQGAAGTTLDFEQTVGSGTYSGVISGGTAVVINSVNSNTGIVTFIGANTYTGGTTVDNGVLLGTSTSLQGPIGVNSGAAVDFEQAFGTGTYSGIISGAGSVIINSLAGDTGTVLFTGTNTYSGGTFINGGVLQGSLSSLQGNMSVNGTGVVDFEQTSGAGTFAGNINGTGGVAINMNATSSGAITFSGTNSYTGGTTVYHGTLLGAPISIQGNVKVLSGALLDLQQAAGTGTFSGNISGGGAVNINLPVGDVGTVVLAGTNTYTGGTIVAHGTLLGMPSALQGNILVESPAILDFEQASGTGATVANISGSGSVVINSLSGDTGTVYLQGINSYTGGTTVLQGTLAGNTSSLQGAIQDNSNVQFIQNSNGIFNGSLTGAGVLTVTGPATLAFNTNNTSFTGTTNVNGGNFLLSASLGGNVIVSNGSFIDNGIVLGNVLVNAFGILSGSGQIDGNVTVANQGTIAPGNSIGTLTIGGSFNQEAGSTYAVQVNSEGQSSLINVAATATLANGSGVQVTALNGVKINAFYKILTAAAGVIGQYSTINVLNSIYTASAIYDANDVYLLFRILFSSLAATYNEKQVARQLDSIGPNPSPEFQKIMQAFSLLDLDQAQHSLSQMSASQYTNLILTAELANRQFIRRVFDPVRQMITENPCTPYVYCQYKPTFDVWSSISGGRSFIDGNRNAPGFRIADYEVIVGAQARFTRTFLIGTAASYERDSIQYHLGGSGRNNVILGGVYALYRPQRFYAWGELNGGYNRNQTTRKINIGTLNYRPKGKCKPYQIAGYAEVGTDFGFDFLLVQPFFGIEAGNFRFNKFKESCGAPLAMDVFDKSYTNVVSRLGIHFTSAALRTGLSMCVDMSWNYRLTSLENYLHVQFQDFGTKFKIKGLPLQRNSFEGAIKFNQRLGKHWSLYFAGNGEGWNNSFTYSFLGGVVASW